MAKDVSGAFKLTTNSMIMEVLVVTKAMVWLATQVVRHGCFLSGAIRMLREVQTCEHNGWGQRRGQDYNMSPSHSCLRTCKWGSGRKSIKTDLQDLLQWQSYKLVSYPECSKTGRTGSSGRAINWSDILNVWLEMETDWQDLLQW